MVSFEEGVGKVERFEVTGAGLNSLELIVGFLFCSMSNCPKVFF